MTLEPEGAEAQEPEEGDWVTEDHVTFCQHEYPRAWQHRVVVPKDQDYKTVLRARMEMDEFWPNVWFVSDHGNWHPMNLEEGK